jgi:hypothetical protein
MWTIDYPKTATGITILLFPFSVSVSLPHSSADSVSVRDMADVAGWLESGQIR